MNDDLPETVKWGLLLGIPTLIVGFLGAAGGLILNQTSLQFRAFMTGRNCTVTSLGLSILYPKDLKVRPIDFDTYLITLIRETSKAHLLNANDCYAHVKTMVLSIEKNLLSSAVRVRAGLGDLNHDGKEDKYTGLTNTAREIQIAATPDRLDGIGYVIVGHTAFAYEALNALIWRFEGHEVAVAENLVKGLKDKVGTGENAKYFERRAKFDAVFKAINWDQ